ncbi:MAG: hypothetical protein CSA81_04040 [Acidobacteria bacterium]|nr:MAG: hypothetical protein CSA81_04040 [Acidobacteriota bacterium]PIE90455.1 MAG: hypothetical protein CR997_05795 [Acidobacteriota bacterium]
MEILNSVMEQGQTISRNSAEMGKTVVYAGLGVLSFVEQKSKGLVEDLVGKGKEYHTDDLTRLKEKVGILKKDVQNQFNKKEAVMETRMQKAFSGILHKLGIPTKDEVQELITHVEKLTKKIEKMKK